ncbi:MAG: hypothetical protein HGA43_02420 [Nitrospirae bacterium]|nr:hypothetical protein [Nitrospirota bacterium]
MENVNKMLLIAVLLSGFILHSAEVRAEKIGIIMFSEESRYAEAAKGIRDRLEEEGIQEPKTTFMEEHAGANKAKAAEIVRKFAAAKMDLIFSLGTSASIAVAREIKDVPIVFSVVFDPVEAGLVKDWKSSGNNLTGTSTLVPMSMIMDNLILLAPVKRLAVLYTPGEKNSESTLKRLQEVQAVYKITVLPVLITKKEEISHILPEIIRTSDAIYLTGSNLVDSEVSMIVDRATRGNVITVTHLEDLAEKGVLLGVCSDSYMLGRLAGGKGIKILKGAKPSSIPTDVLKNFSVILNMKTVAAGGFKISPDVMKKITRTIE